MYWASQLPYVGLTQCCGIICLQGSFFSTESGHTMGIVEYEVTTAGLAWSLGDNENHY